MEIVFKDECYAIMGACYEVYKEKGAGFLEAVYQQCLVIEFRLQGIDCQQQKPLPLQYKGEPLKQTYVADFVCMDKIILEIKAVAELTDIHRAQVHNYLKATGMKLGLLINFGHVPKLQSERIVR